jgi:hypothetical protein
MWNPYSADDMIVTLIIGKSAMDLWTSVVPIIFFEPAELHCLDRVMRQFNFKQHISSNLDTRDQLHSISCLDRHADYNWITHHLPHILMWDTRRTFIFKKVYFLIFEEKYMYLLRIYNKLVPEYISPNYYTKPNAISSA